MLKDYFNAHRQSCLESARQCLIDNGIETDEVGTVLQALCYILLNEEIQENEPSNAKVLPKTSSVNNDGYAYLNRAIIVDGCEAIETIAVSKMTMTRRTSNRSWKTTQRRTPTKSLVKQFWTIPLPLRFVRTGIPKSNSTVIRTKAPKWLSITSRRYYKTMGTKTHPSILMQCLSCNSI